jgi:mannose-6-phosphate isomerase-like protein (cupin superfamily)
MDMKGKVKTIKDSEFNKFGDEYYTIYFDTDLLTSGIATVSPNGKSDIDDGHKDAEEVFTVVKGKIVVKFPDKNQQYELEQGDAIIVPINEAHMVENHTDEEAILAWTVVPGL